MNKKKIIALLLSSLLISNFGTNIVIAETNNVGLLASYQSEAISEKLVPKSEIVVTATSAQTNEGADKAIDGNTSTLWHTPWTGVNIAEKPESITLNLGKVRNISSINITPRQSGSNGIIKNYKIYAGTTVVSEGTWSTDTTTKVVLFNQPVATDKIKIEAISTIGDTINKYASIAEVDVYEANEIPIKLASLENLQITSGSGGDLSSNLENVLNKEEGTAIIRFQSNNTALQSLFSISNNARANEHFHVYINGGQIGYELRKQSGNVSTGVVSKVLNTGMNTIAFKAEKNKGYSMYLNGEKVLDISLATANFLAALEGANTFKVGSTDRASGYNEYNFTGKIDFFEFYNQPLVDRYLKEITSETASQVLPLPEGSIKTAPINVYTPGELGSSNFRIPSLITTKAGTLLAGIDVRVGGGGDSPNNIDSGIKRSTDNGETWDTGKILLNYPDSASGIDTSLLQDTTTDEIFMLVDAFPHGGGTWQAQRGSGYKDITVNGATVRAMELTHTTNGAKYYVLPFEGDAQISNVVDSNGNSTEYTVDLENNLYKDNVKIGNTFAASCELKAFLTCYLALISSKDDGVTWSKPKLISGQFKKEWMSFLGTGPGRGYEIKNGSKAGRLIFPVYSLNINQKQSTAVIYSDDHGKTWKISESVNDNRVVNGVTIQGETFTGKAGEEMTEAQVVEMPNGELKMFMRNPGGGRPAVATSKDGGETWEDIIEYETDLKEPYCQLSVINYNGLIDGKPAIIFSNPNSSSRSEGTVQIGLINNIGTAENPVWDFEWKYKKLVKSGFYAYSCLTQLNNGNIGLFYEGTGSQEMSYTQMNVNYLKADLLADAPKPKVSSITSIDSVEDYNPGDTFNLKLLLDQTVSFIGDRSLELLINDKEIPVKISRVSGNEYKLTGIVPQDIKGGSYKIFIKSKSGLEIINSTGKTLDLSSNIQTESTIDIKNEVAEEVKFNLNAAESINTGENLDIKLSLSDIDESLKVTAIEAILTYDSTKFQLEEGGISDIDDTKTLTLYNEVTPGNVQILIATKAVPVASESQIINIRLKGKSGTEATNIGISGVYSDDSENIKEAIGKSISVKIKDKIVVDKSNLVAVISQGELLKENNYTKDTWVTFKEIFEKAKSVNNNLNASQVEVNEMVDSLEKAITSLEREEEKIVYTEALEIAIEMAENITEEELKNVIPIVKKEFSEALQEARGIIDQIVEGKNISQDIVNSSFDRLAKAMQMLEFKGDKTNLLLLVEQIKGLNANNYTMESWSVLQTVLNSQDVQEVIKDENALEADITKVYNLINDAFIKLEIKIVNKDLLNNLLDTIKELSNIKYTPSTWGILQGVFIISNEVSANKEATQEEVDNAYKTLLKSYLQLRIKANKENLKELIKNATEIDNSKYTNETIETLTISLKNAKIVFENDDATEEDVKNAENSIEIAIAGLKEKDEIKTPGQETPGKETPGGETPGKETPGGETPGKETPGKETPGGETPGEETSGGKTSEIKIPGAGSSINVINSVNNESLPKTGDNSSTGVGVFGVILAIVGGVFLKKKK